jgi:hypothetical protein
MKRRTAIGGAAASLLLAASGAAWKLHVFGKHYPPTPYDDLLGQIVDREAAARLGRIVNRERPGMTLPDLAETLRRPRLSLAAQAQRDTGPGRLMEVRGWVLPESVGEAAALAASV